MPNRIDALLAKPETTRAQPTELPRSQSVKTFTITTSSRHGATVLASDYTSSFEDALMMH